MIYVADLEEWLQIAIALTYADDTSTSVSGDTIEEIIRLLELDAKNVLTFMASNGLAANAKKTTFIILNNTKANSNTELIKINVGKEVITQERNAKLLGITMDDSQKWDSQIYGTGGLISSLNSRLFMIKRLRNEINKESLIKIADSLYTSKLRYGLGLFGKIRWTEEDITTTVFKDIQKNQNKLLRYLNNTKLSDKISTKSILEKFNQLSVNQLNASIKLCDIWKAINVKNYPTKVIQMSPDINTTQTRSITYGKLKESGKSVITQATLINDAIRAWNRAPKEVHLSTSYNVAKKNIKSFVKTLPI